jgi:hypothetical protein
VRGAGIDVAGIQAAGIRRIGPERSEAESKVAHMADQMSSAAVGEHARVDFLSGRADFNCSESKIDGLLQAGAYRQSKVVRSDTDRVAFHQRDYTVLGDGLSPGER